MIWILLATLGLTAEVTLCVDTGEDAELADVLVDRLIGSLEGAGNTVVRAEEGCGEEGPQPYVFVTLACEEDACDWDVSIASDEGTGGNSGEQRPRNFALSKIDAFVSRNLGAPPPPAVAVAPEPTPEPAPPPAPAPEPPPPAPELPKEWARPSGFVGIGIGTSTGPGPIGLNTASARFRISEGFSLEPTVSVAFSSTTASTTFDPITATFPTGTTTGTTGTGSTTIYPPSLTTETSVFAPSAGALLRGRIAEGGPVDLCLLAGADFTYAASSTTTRESVVEVDSSDTDTIALAMSWGLGLEAFATANWSVTMDALNPLVTYATTSIPDDGSNTTVTDTIIGVGFDPVVRVMTHIYL